MKAPSNSVSKKLTSFRKFLKESINEKLYSSTKGGYGGQGITCFDCTTMAGNPYQCFTGQNGPCASTDEDTD